MNNTFLAHPSDLPAEYVSGGKVTKRLVYKSSDTEVAILELAPGAEIKLHEHTEDSELYFIIGTGLVDLCPIGASHRFENATPDKVLLLSVKTTKKPEIREGDVTGSKFVFGA